MATKATTAAGTDDIGSENVGAFHIKFSDIKSLSALPDGKYDVVIREAKPGVSQANLPKMDLVFVIEDAEDDALNGRRIYDVLSFAPLAKWRVKAFLLALGYEEDYEGDITPGELEGERLVVTVAMDTQTKINPETGKPYEPRPRVKAFAPAGSNVEIDDVL